MELDKETIEIAVAAVASKTTYVGSGSAILAWAMSVQIVPAVGVLIAIVSAVINWYYKREQNRRELERREHEREEHAARMRNLMSGFDPNTPRK